MAINPITIAHTVNEQFFHYQVTAFPIADEVLAPPSPSRYRCRRSLSLSPPRLPLSLSDFAIAPVACRCRLPLSPRRVPYDVPRIRNRGAAPG